MKTPICVSCDKLMSYGVLSGVVYRFSDFLSMAWTK